MGKQKQNFIGYNGCSKYLQWHCCVGSKICEIPQQLAQAGSGIPRIRQYFVWDPRSLGSNVNVSVTGSKISNIPWENENISSNILQDPGSWILRIQDLGFSLGSRHTSSRIADCLFRGVIVGGGKGSSAEWTPRVYHCYVRTERLVTRDRLDLSPSAPFRVFDSQS